MKRIGTILLCLLLSVSLMACGMPSTEHPSDTAINLPTKATGPSPKQTPAAEVYLDASRTTAERAADLLAKMTLADKAGQMVQGEQYPVTDANMADLGLGSVLSGGGSVPDNDNTVEHWNKVIDGFQKAALSRKLKIPFIYGADAVHGHNTLYGAVIFPHNIGIGAANNPSLTEQMGAFVAEEMKLTGIRWNFAPCVAVVQDPRWGRTYESFSSDSNIVCELASAYLKGQRKGGVLATAKHYVADGGTTYGTGEKGYPLDRGDARMSEQQLRAIHLAPYKRLVEDGVQCVMASFNSYEGLKLHENKFLLTDVLKNELGFAGFVVSDWEGVREIDAPSFDKQIIAAVNAGVDMLMEPYKYREAIKAIEKGVKSGDIAQQRVDDAVKRILTVKFDMGLFDDPYGNKIDIAVAELGSEQGRALAQRLVEKSQVLLKNENNVLPLKKGQKIYITGPAADNIGIQCGGWTLSWQGLPQPDLTKGTTILGGFSAIAAKYGFAIITDPAKAHEADVVVLAVGEIPYAEYEGDTEDLSLTGKTGLPGNKEAIAEAKMLAKPTIALIVAGRNVLIGDYLRDWDAAVMCYLPGTEGGGMVLPLVGEVPFTGKLPMPWYKSVRDIGQEKPDLLFPLGYGLKLDR